uniref:Photosystem I reaction center subunit VIII n=1 Tax=Callipsygma wilsonis TaxID=2320807 RepID=A0A386B016_9CHLO|nr:photosystem I reaction center subunit VIII [Callipsygma wilsonis]AYC65037.1 photosystem I reaction center subunit VIII [Callipsygma wilsonis]
MTASYLPEIFVPLVCLFFPAISIVYIFFYIDQYKRIYNMRRKFFNIIIL